MIHRRITDQREVFGFQTAASVLGARQGGERDVANRAHDNFEQQVQHAPGHAQVAQQRRAQEVAHHQVNDALVARAQHRGERDR
jgi:hypothetical protein